MGKQIFIFIFVAAFLLTGCAKDFYTSYQSNNTDKEVGSLIIRLPDAAKNVNVTLDGNLVAEEKFTERIEIDNVPAGKHEVKVIASSWELKRDINKTEQVDIQPHGNQAMLVEVPPKSTGYWVFRAVTFSVIFTPFFLW